MRELVNHKETARGRKGRAVWFGEESASLGSEVKGKHCVGFRFCGYVHMLFCIAVTIPSSMWLKGKVSFFYGSCWPVRLQTLKCFFSKKRSVLIFQSQWRHKDSSYPLWPPLFTSQVVFSKLPTVITVTAVHIVMLWIVENGMREDILMTQDESCMVNFHSQQILFFFYLQS